MKFPLMGPFYIFRLSKRGAGPPRPPLNRPLYCTYIYTYAESFLEGILSEVVVHHSDNGRALATNINNKRNIYFRANLFQVDLYILHVYEVISACNGNRGAIEYD